MKTENYTEEVHQGRIEMMEALGKCHEAHDLEEFGDSRAPLCIDTKLVKDIVLSTGGPADGFKLTFAIADDGSKELAYGVYYRADWGTYKESSLSGDEAQTVFDFYLGGYIE